MSRLAARIGLRMLIIFLLASLLCPLGRFAAAEAEKAASANNSAPRAEATPPPGAESVSAQWKAEQPTITTAFTTREYRQVNSTDLAGEGFDSLKLDNANGTVGITGWDRPRISIVAIMHLKLRKTISASAGEQLFRQIKVKLTRTGKSLCVVSSAPPMPRLGGLGWSIDYQIQLPRSLRIATTTGNGAIGIAGITSPVRAQTGNGRIQLEKIQGQVRGLTGNGEIAAADIDGTVSLTTGNGAITCSGIQGDVKALSGNGKIEVKAVQGRVMLNNGNGGIACTDVDGDMTLKCQTGTASITQSRVFAQARRILVEKKVGEIRLILAKAQPFTLDASSKSGSIISDFPIRIEGKGPAKSARGTIGEGGPAIELKTDTGSIIIRQH